MVAIQVIFHFLVFEGDFFLDHYLVSLDYENIEVQSYNYLRLK